MNIGFAGLLALVFVVAKLMGVVAWSWWLVFAPMWLPLLVGSIILLGVAVVKAIAD